jgi:hypothetical protein
MPPKKYNIACVIMGEYKPFLIKIDNTELVGNLKNMIKEAKNALAKFDADHLKLYQVEIPKSDDMGAAVRDKMTENPVELYDLDQLDHVFVGGPKKDNGMVHIIVQPPEPGK